MNNKEHIKKIKEAEERRKQKIQAQAEEQRRLAKRSARRMAKLIKFTTSKVFACGLLALVQLALLFIGFVFLNGYINETAFLIVCQTLGIIFAVYVINSKTANEYKLVWVLFILAFTVLGILAYLLFGRQKISKRKMKKLRKNIDCVLAHYAQDESILEKAEEADAFLYKTANYVCKNSRLPLSAIGESVYFDIGEEFFERLKTELTAAKKFIFMEYFIIAKGRMWQEIFEILKEKALSGVEIRIIYDDLGCLNLLPKNMAKECAETGIKLYCFNKLRPFLDVSQNNRTHRKITVIDGRTAFTGGLNLANEYINLINKHGHWKDTGVMIKGSAVKNFSLMFLLNWTAKFGAEDISRFMPGENCGEQRNEQSEEHDKTQNDKDNNSADNSAKDETFCLPFCDTPGSNRAICEELYVKMIYNAKEYVYINTPYFIVGDRVKHALISAAESGVDVRITVPHIPDQKIVFGLTRAFYAPLLAHGVKVYEYEPGFIHAKSIVSDDKYCIIGSSNMDFRSFYLHYECNVFMHKGICKDLRLDYEKTCNLSLLITEPAVNASLPKRVWRAVLRLFAPLM